MARGQQMESLISNQDRQNYIRDTQAAGDLNASENVVFTDTRFTPGFFDPRPQSGSTDFSQSPDGSGGSGNPLLLNRQSQVNQAGRDSQVAIDNANKAASMRSAEMGLDFAPNQQANIQAAASKAGSMTQAGFMVDRENVGIQNQFGMANLQNEFQDKRFFAGLESQENQNAIQNQFNQQQFSENVRQAKFGENLQQGEADWLKKKNQAPRRGFDDDIRNPFSTGAASGMGGGRGSTTAPPGWAERRFGKSDGSGSVYNPSDSTSSQARFDDASRDAKYWFDN